MPLRLTVEGGGVFLLGDVVGGGVTILLGDVVGRELGSLVLGFTVGDFDGSSVGAFVGSFCKSKSWVRLDMCYINKSKQRHKGTLIYTHRCWFGCWIS